MDRMKIPIYQIDAFANKAFLEILKQLDLRAVINLGNVTAI